MGGPNLEVFEFGLYLFPLATMYYYGDSGWYRQDLMSARVFSAPRENMHANAVWLVQETIFPSEQ